MIHRNYDPERDREDCHRIWLEVGWIEKDQEKVMDTFLDGCRVLVADLDGPGELLADLDQVISVPVPSEDWDF